MPHLDEHAAIDPRFARQTIERLTRRAISPSDARALRKMESMLEGTSLIARLAIIQSAVECLRSLAECSALTNAIDSMEIAVGEAIEDALDCRCPITTIVGDEEFTELHPDDPRHFDF